MDRVLRIIMDEVNKEIDKHKNQNSYVESKLYEKFCKYKSLVYQNWNEYMRDREVSIKNIKEFLMYCFDLVTSHIRANISIYKLTKNPHSRRLEKVLDRYELEFRWMRNKIVDRIKEEILNESVSR